MAARSRRGHRALRVELAPPAVARRPSRQPRRQARGTEHTRNAGGLRCASTHEVKPLGGGGDYSVRSTVIGV
eukprot:3741199-Prymnesium_polylepis.1